MHGMQRRERGRLGAGVPTSPKTGRGHAFPQAGEISGGAGGYALMRAHEKTKNPQQDAAG